MKDRAAIPLEDIFEWDVGNWSRVMPIWESALPKGKPMRCLEIGGRRGGLSLWLASQGHEVLCSDLEDPAELARPLHEKYGLSERIAYGSIDACAIPFEREFDLVVFKSVLGGIGRNGDTTKQALAIRQIHKALKPGGRMLFAENLRGTPVHGWLRRRFTRWGGYWNYLRLEESKGLFSPFAFFRAQAWGCLGAFGRTERQRALLGAADKLMDRTLPSRWKYIVGGYAERQG